MKRKLYIKNINYDNLSIEHHHKYYQPVYILNNTIKVKNIISIFNVKNIQIVNYNIHIFSDNFDNLKIIDKFLNNNISNYIQLFPDSTNDYIVLPLNCYTKNITINKTIQIYILHVKKSNYIPIIHVI